METVSPSTTVQSSKELEDFVGNSIILNAEYQINTPPAPGGPHGEMRIMIAKQYGIQTAFGYAKITTSWSVDHLFLFNFEGNAKFNGSTGVTTIIAAAKGLVEVNHGLFKPLNTEIKILLRPGFKEGVLSVEHFFENLPIKVVH